MKIVHRECPIGVISTNTQASAAIGIIRLSGFSNINDFSETLSVSKWVPRFAHLLKVTDEEGNILDEGIGLYFEGPNSFTGENVLELHLHGNPLNLQRILDFICSKYEIETALPGEFSYRAFRNDKLNLSQVEGLDLLLNANSGFGLSAANEMLSNELYKDYVKMRNDFLELRAAIELSIDFSEDVGEEQIKSKISSCMDFLGGNIESLNQRCGGSLSDLLTPSVGLFGKTNAGKSTLFNKLVRKERAIVSEIHGTTRDYVSEYWNVLRQPFRLLDTAGLRASQDLVEKEGISRSLALFSESFFKILVVNPYQDISGVESHLLEDADAIVLTHLDRTDGVYKLDENFNSKIKKFSFDGPIGADHKFGPIGPVFKMVGPIGPENESGPIGATRDNGPIGPVQSLEELVIEKYQRLTEGNPIPIQRHRDLILAIFEKYQALKVTLEQETDLAIISSDINMLGNSMDELLGIVNSQEVLDHIFANFCIGK
jgi:tRNA modification GTPase